MLGYKDPINPDYPATSAMYHKVDIIAIKVFVSIGLVDEYSIRTKDPNNHSDTETGTLSTIRFNLCQIIPPLLCVKILGLFSSFLCF